MDSNMYRVKPGRKRVKKIGKRQQALLYTLAKDPTRYIPVSRIPALQKGSRNHKYYIIRDYIGRGFLEKKKSNNKVYLKITVLGRLWIYYHLLGVKYGQDRATREDLIKYHYIKKKLRSLGFKFERE